MSWHDDSGHSQFFKGDFWGQAWYSNGAWCWRLKWGTHIHFLSYDQKLSLRDAIRARELISDPWYQARWGGESGVRIPHQNQRSAAYYKNNHGGMRITVTLQGGSTGHHAHIQCVDDPICERRFGVH